MQTTLMSNSRNVGIGISTLINGSKNCSTKLPTLHVYL